MIRTTLASPAQTPALLARYLAVRRRSMDLAAPLSEADCQLQSMPDTSPTKWHLAHITWFFETFVLEQVEPDFRPFDPAFRVLFNSYYNVVGDKHPRPRRGQISRPDLARVKAYRAQVDARMRHLLESPPAGAWQAVVELGLQHEQQHQELLLTDIKHALSCNPMLPIYQAGWPLASVAPVPTAWHECAAGLVEIGHSGDDFAFDNELPRHKTWLAPHALANRVVTHGEWAEFIADGGYRDPRWWLAAGWEWVCTGGIEAPLYWQRGGDAATPDWHSFTLHGQVPIDAHTPISHISYFEADAFARWISHVSHAHRGSRLPTEGEWEACAARHAAITLPRGNFVESRALHPLPVATVTPEPMQLFGDVWEWTSSAYNAYPGYRPWSGAVGEYNGKFMVNQYVLRGGSCVTPRSHIRASYRNFFPTDARWQFSGVRLARDID